jgi:CheY-like chemotaxis protein/two-component sensor histidine kinase
MMREPGDAVLIERGLDIVARNTRLQAQLISDLLDISRIVAGKLQLEMQPVDLASIVEDAIETVEQDALARGLSVDRDLEAAPAHVTADPARLQQVVWNLLSNAIKFTPAGGKITVRLGRRGDDAEIVVSDTGTGIRPEVLPHIFDRFHQADNSITRRFGGLGLGLSIVKHLVELHGGSVSAESEGEGRGARFVIRLPAVAMTTVAGAEPAVPPDPQEAATLERLRILVVEDDRDTQEFLVRLLEAHGAAVTRAMSADQALALLASTDVDLLLSDIGLPDMDGYDLIHQVRGRAGDNVPAIALTAYARTEDRIRALAAGYQAHVAKPVEPQELLSTVARVARRSSVRRSVR